jgi:hypothetical protein
MAALRAEAQVAADPLAIGETIGWLNLRIMELRELETQQVALDELLDWVIGDATDEKADVQIADVQIADVEITDVLAGE